MFAIAGGKGGCGKTTTALGLARALAEPDVTPLVVDADVDMPDLHLLADVPAEPNAGDIAAGAHIECAVHEPPATPGVAIVPAGRDDETATALARLRDWDGPVLVDCPAGASADATRPLRAAERTVLVTTDTPQSLGDAEKTARVADRLGAPVAATLIRGPDASGVAPPADTPVCETVSDAADGPVRSDPAFRLACDSIAEVIRSTERAGPDGRERTTP